MTNIVPPPSCHSLSNPSSLVRKRMNFWLELAGGPTLNTIFLGNAPRLNSFPGCHDNGRLSTTTPWITGRFNSGSARTDTTATPSRPRRVKTADGLTAIQVIMPQFVSFWRVNGNLEVRFFGPFCFMPFGSIPEFGEVFWSFSVLYNPKC